MKRSFSIPTAIIFVLAATVGACSAGYDDAYDDGFDDEEVPEQGPLGKADNANCNETELRKCLDNGGGNACYDKWQCEPDCDVTELRKCLDNGGGDPCYDKWYCEPGDEEGVGDSYDAVLGDSLARAARNGAVGYSMGKCYEYVWGALRSVLGAQIESLPIPATSAYQFGEWIIANPSTAKTRLRLVRTMTPARSAPRGSVIVWPRGVCGAHPTHGHIEIAQGDGTACSDYCGLTWTCTPQVFMPVR